MKFEDALREMRMGAKITHKYLGEDVYFMGCYVTFKGIDDSGRIREPTEQEREESKQRGISIVKMLGDKQHPDMIHKNFPIKQNCCDHGLHDCPQLNLFLITSDDWEII